MFYKPKILIVDDDKELLETLKLDISKRFKKFDVVACASAEEAFNKIKQYDMNGDPIAFVLSDERMPGKSGYEFLKELKVTHPKARKGILTAYGEKDHAIKSFQEASIDFYLDKPCPTETIEKNIKSSLEKYIDSLGLELKIGDIYVREVETRYELEQAFRLRYDVYVEEMKYISKNRLDAESLQTKMEKDEFDNQSLTTHLVAMKDGIAIGYVRLIDGICPMENDTFNLNEYRNNNILPREVSRLIVEKKFRRSEVTLALLRLVYNYSKDREYLFCTSTKTHEKMYRKIGFKKMQETPLKNYKLTGMWYPFVLDINDTVQNCFNLKDVNGWLVKMITLPISNKKIRNTISYYRNIIYKLGYLLNK